MCMLVFGMACDFICFLYLLSLQVALVPSLGIWLKICMHSLVLRQQGGGKEEGRRRREKYVFKRTLYEGWHNKFLVCLLLICFLFQRFCILPMAPYYTLWAIAAPNSTQSWVGLIFLCKPQNHKATPHQTVCHFFSAPTQPNSTKFSMQPYFNLTRRFMQKKSKIFKIGFWPPKKIF